MIRVDFNNLIATFRDGVWSSGEFNATRFLNNTIDWDNIPPDAIYYVSKRNKEVAGLDAVALDAIYGLGGKLVENKPDELKLKSGVVI